MPSAFLRVAIGPSTKPALIHFWPAIAADLILAHPRIAVMATGEVAEHRGIAG